MKARQIHATHCRCRSCGARRKLKMHPDSYQIQPRCLCGSRSWRKDEYRHRVELPQMRNKAGRYKVCHADCYHHPHRMGFGDCKFLVTGEYKIPLQ